MIFSDEKKENYIYQDDQNISCWNRYLLMYPHKCTLKILKKKYQEKWENAYLRVKNARASRALRQVLDPRQYCLASLAWLRFAMLAKSREKFLAPRPNPGSATDRVDVQYFTDHLTQGACTMFYWSPYTEWVHNVLLITLHRVDAQLPTDHLKQGGCTVSYWSPCTWWMHNSLQRVDPNWIYLVPSRLI